MTACSRDEDTTRGNGTAGGGGAVPGGMAAPSLRVIVVDDESLALDDTVHCVADADDATEVAGFTDAASALDWLREHEADIALLDIEMPQMNGLDLAVALQQIRPAMRVVFVTSFESYALNAFAVHAQGYLLKPVDVDALRYELDIARAARTGSVAPVAPAPAPTQASVQAAGPRKPSKRVGAQSQFPEPLVPHPVDPLLTCVTFGGFEVYANGRPLAFRRRRSKELMALLVDRRGAPLTLREGVTYLWPDNPFDNAKRSYYQSIVSGLRATLRHVGAEDVLVKGWNSLAIDPSRIDCDLYRFLDGDQAAISSYRHDYLPQYEWSEATVAVLEERR